MNAVTKSLFKRTKDWQTNLGALLVLCSAAAGAQSSSGSGGFAPDNSLQDDGDVLYLYPADEFTLEQGHLTVSGIIVGEGDTAFRSPGAEPVFTQTGGELRIENNLIVGQDYHGSGMFNLSNGLIFAGAIVLGANRDAAGTFMQSGGTNSAQRLIISHEADEPMTLPDVYARSGYFMSGGRLATVETVVGDGREGLFRQSGGEHEVSGGLWVQGCTAPSSYYLTGGKLSAHSLHVNRADFEQSGGTNTISELFLAGRFMLMGGCFRCLGTAQFQGGCFAAAGGQTALGPLGLSQNSSIEFGANPCELKWANSRTEAWGAGALLNIVNWQGSLAGGGYHQLVFGTNAAGVTGEQLARIIFVNPAGMVPGDYPGRILATGEVVPGRRPLLKAQFSGGALFLNWASPWQLEVATQACGPFSDVTNGLEDYIHPEKGGPRRFFRLKY